MKNKIKIDRWSTKAKRLTKYTTLSMHATAVLFSLVIGLAIFIVINIFFLPKTLSLPKTTAINWLVLHKHSMTLDYMRFGLFVLIIPTSVIAGWVLLVWRRDR